jgi:hypothetical protein
MRRCAPCLPHARARALERYTEAKVMARTLDLLGL